MAPHEMNDLTPLRLAVRWSVVVLALPLFPLAVLFSFAFWAIHDRWDLFEDLIYPWLRMLFQPFTP